jgi:uncharacterized membrane protein (Fun14 family)
VALAALRRLLTLTVGVAAATVGISALVGFALGSSLNRAISLGLYVLGCFLLISGFFVGNRGPVRLKNDTGHPMFGSRVVRWASPEEREETLNLSAVFVVLGFVLILLGVVADNRFTLF